MAVMAPPRESWTDQRLDDLKEHMDEGFRDVRGEIVELRSEVVQVREGLGEVRAEIKGINKTLQVGFGLIGSFLSVLGVLIATQM